MKVSFYKNKKTGIFLICCIASLSYIQAQLVTTIAGGGNGDGGTPLNTSIFPLSITSDNSSNIFFGVGYPYYCIRKIGSGIVTTVVNKPGDAMATDVSGNLYFANNNEHKIYKLTPAGQLSVIAGTGVAGNTGDGGPATSAAIGNILSLAVAATGEIFFSDNSNHVYRKIGTDGIINQFAAGAPPDYFIGVISGSKVCLVGSGGGVYAFGLSGNSLSILTVNTLPSNINSIATNPGNPNLYVSTLNNRVYKNDFTNNILNPTLFAGTGTAGNNGDGGPATSAQINTATGGICLSGANLLISSSTYIRQVVSGTISTIAGNGTNPSIANSSGDGLEARLAGLGFGGLSMTMDAPGNIFIADYYGGRIRKINASNNIISTLPGGGNAGLNEGGFATDAGLGNVSGVALDNADNIYLSHTLSGVGRIRKVDASGIITTIAGGGATTPANNVVATSANFNSGIQEVLYLNNKVYFRTNNNVWEINSSGNLRLVYTISGLTPVKSISGNGSFLYVAYSAGAFSSNIIKVTISNNQQTNFGSFGATIDNIFCDNSENIYFKAGVNLYVMNSIGQSTQLSGLCSSTCTNDEGVPLENLANVSDGIYKSSSGLFFFTGTRLKYVCNSNTLLAADNSSTYSIGTASTVQYLVDFCDILFGIQRTGSSPVTGSINSTISILPAVQNFNGQPYVQRIYDLTPIADPSNATATLTLFFRQFEFTNYNTAAGPASPKMPASPADATGISNLRITQYHGIGTSPGNYIGWSGPGAATVLINPDDDKIIWNAVSSRWEVTFDITGFSGFYLHTTNTNTPLPVTLLNFDGHLQNDNTVLLKWETENEINTSHFEIEHSLNGTSFSKIGSVSAVNNSSTVNLYQFVHNLNEDGNHYYRLKMIDIDGKFNYSKVVKVWADKNSYELFVISPNPTNSTVNIAGKYLAVVSIHDLSGKLIFKKNVHGTSSAMIDVSFLSKGIYTVTAQSTDGQRQTRKLMIY